MNWVRPKVWIELAENGFLFVESRSGQSELMSRLPNAEVPDTFPDQGWGIGRWEGLPTPDDGAAMKPVDVYMRDPEGNVLKLQLWALER